jgi:hypothetical protein
VGPTLIKQLREGKRTGLEDEGPRMPGFGQRGGGGRTHQKHEGVKRTWNPENYNFQSTFNFWPI